MVVAKYCSRLDTFLSRSPAVALADAPARLPWQLVEIEFYIRHSLCIRSGLG